MNRSFGMAAEPALYGARKIIDAIRVKGGAVVAIEPDCALLEVLSILSKTTGIDWSRVILVQLSEFVGISTTHSGSLTRFLKERFAANLPKPLGAACYLDGNDPGACDQELRNLPIDLCFLCDDKFPQSDDGSFCSVVNVDEKYRRQKINIDSFHALSDLQEQMVNATLPYIMHSGSLVNVISQRCGGLPEASAIFCGHRDSVTFLIK